MHYWARHSLYSPSVDRSPRVWSFLDLLALRMIYWLRQPKNAFAVEVPATSVPKIRRALDNLRRLSLDLFEEGRPVIAVDLEGEIVINSGALPRQHVGGQLLLEPGVIDLLAPFSGLEGAQGPDLRMPRPTLRIIPRKISGAPHIDGTRLPTQSIIALADRGYDTAAIAKIYPFVSPKALEESIELERQLQRNLRPAA